MNEREEFSLYCIIEGQTFTRPLYKVISDDCTVLYCTVLYCTLLSYITEGQTFTKPLNKIMN